MITNTEPFEKEFDEQLHTFIVQPSGGEKCPTCNYSGSYVLSGGTREFCPALAYIDTVPLKAFIRTQIATARDEGYEAGLNLRKEYDDQVKEVAKQEEWQRIETMVKEIRRRLVPDDTPWSEPQEGADVALGLVLASLHQSEER